MDSFNLVSDILKSIIIIKIDTNNAEDKKEKNKETEKKNENETNETKTTIIKGKTIPLKYCGKKQLCGIESFFFETWYE